MNLLRQKLSFLIKLFFKRRSDQPGPAQEIIIQSFMSALL